MIHLAWLIPLAPALAFVAISLFTLRWRDLSSYLTIGAIGLSFILAVGIFFEVGAGARWEASVAWLAIGPAEHLSLGFLVDPLTALMLVIVTSVSLLVQVYSRGYMQGDPGFSRYFAFMALFTMSMLGLVLAANLLTLFIFWELVGLSSYLLIGFWYQKPEAAAAARKAFIVTRFGDFGLLVGILLLWSAAGTLAFGELGALAQAGALEPTVVTIAALLLFAGAVGKSAQFPLHVWLPDAMEGPSPVSALIHAATMVAAGVYLVARSFELFSASATAMLVVAVIGGFTAVFAASMALVNNDIKRVLAFSTVSQLGYMMLGLGALSLAAGMFHLFTHAFFKALLFLAAGSLIHATHTQDLREMGGLRHAMPVTFWTMVIGALSLAGLFPLAGFWSKDEVLADTLARAGEQPVYGLLFAFAAATVLMTAFYMFRAVFLAFTGPPRGHGHPHESPWVMGIPLLLLAVPSVLVGFWGSPLVPLPSSFGGYLEGDQAHAVVLSAPLVLGSTLLAALGIGLAYLMYVRGSVSPQALGQSLRPIYQVLSHRYWIDELYGWLVARLVLGGSLLIALFDRTVVDGAVNGVGRALLGGGGALRQVQTGRVQAYGLAVFGGLVVIAAVLLSVR